MSMSTEKKCLIMFAAGLSLFIGCGAYRAIHHDLNRTEVVYIERDKPTEAAVVTTVYVKPQTSTKRVTSTSAKASAVTTTAVDIPLHININTATAEELEKLKGVGPHISAEIVAYRERCGGFMNIDEIKNVKGIGDAVFENIRMFIYVDSPYYPEESAEPDEPVQPEEPTEPELRLEDVIPIDLNSADIETLMLLPYVDEPIAERIIELRGQLNGFDHVYELLIVEELTREQVAEILEYVYASEKTTEE